MHSPDLVAGNIEKIAALFPNCITEAKDATGKLTRGVDFDLLKQELSGSVVDGPQERYRLDWPGKREALLAANTPIAKTLRPCREESVDFDTTKNLFIEGDNLEALKLLQETYLNSVKIVFIDPPYNTGEDFIYSDKFEASERDYLISSNQVGAEGNRFVSNPDSNGRFHSDWLSMLMPRLKLALNVMTDDGVIFISIDDGESQNIRKICDEVFGEKNFLATFIWEKRTSRENRKVFSVSQDYIHCYAKNRENYKNARGLLPYTDEVLSRYTNPDNDARGAWQSVSLSVQGGHGTQSQFYDITTPSGRIASPPSGLCWRFTSKKLQELIADNRIWFGSDGGNIPRLKLFLSEVEQGLTPHTLWKSDEVGTTDSAKRETNALFGGTSVFETVKPIALLKRLIKIGSNNEKNDIILDFFAGSASTAHAVMALNAEDSKNRRFIMVQIPDACDNKSEAFKSGYATVSSISKDRIRLAGQKIKKDSATTVPDLDIGFRALKIDTSNFKDIYYQPDTTNRADLLDQVDNIREDRTPEDLLFQVMLDWGVDLGLPISSEVIAGKKVFFVDGNALAACFDSDISEELVTALAKRRLHDLPLLKVVFRDAGYASDSAKINVEQIFKLLSPTTELRTL